MDAEALLVRAAALDLFPLAFHRLRLAGVSLNPSWEESFRANSARNLFLHHEQGRLLAQLRQAGVCAAPLKGTALAELAYGDLSLRTQVDVDLYVSPRDLPRALEALQAAGYRLTAPRGVSAARLAATGMNSPASARSNPPSPACRCCWSFTGAFFRWMTMSCALRWPRQASPGCRPT
jgi:hypothetical protein